MVLRGKIDKFDNGILSGWVDNTEYDGPIIIDVRVNGIISVKDVRADQRRSDLVRAGIGDGFRSFRVPIRTIVECGEVTFSVHCAGEEAPFISRKFKVNPTTSYINPIRRGTLSGFSLRREGDQPDRPVDIEIWLDNKKILTEKARPRADDIFRVPFELDLGVMDMPTQRRVLRLLEAGDPERLVLTLHRVNGTQPSQAEARHVISSQEISDLKEYFELVGQRILQNALLLRRALEVRGLWLGRALEEADIEVARRDPAVLCIDPLHFRATTPTEIESDTPAEDLTHFRKLASNHDVMPNLLFSEAWYRCHRKETAQALIAGDVRSGLDHYLTRGLDAGFLPHEGFVAASDAPHRLGRDLLDWMVGGEGSAMPTALGFSNPEISSWNDFVHTLVKPRSGAAPDWGFIVQGNLRDRDWVLINTNTHTRNIHITRAILEDARGILGRAKVHMAGYDNVVDICMGLDSPVLLCLDGQRLNVNILQRAIRYCAVAALWTFDDPYNLGSHLEIVDLFDLIFTNDRSCLSAYGERGFYLPLAAPASLIDETDASEPMFDIFFCGTAWPNRVTLINRLIGDRPHLRFKIALTYNAAVPPLPLDAPVSSYVQSLSFADYIGYARRSRITLSLHRSFSGTDVLESSSNPGPRVFEIGAAGAYQISESGGDGFEALFPRDELAYYDSYEELLNLIDAAICWDPEARRAATRKLRERVAAQHTYRHRMATIVKELARVCAASPAPLPAAPRKLPRLLYVVHNTISAPSFGGLEVHQDILAQNLKDRYEIFFFYTAVDGGQNGRRAILTDCRYNELDRSEKIFSIGHGNLENPEIEKFFSNCLDDFDFDLIHFFQFINSVPSLALIAKAHGVPYGVSLHDFYIACREFNLLDHTGRFCQNDHTKLGDCDICLRKRFDFPAKSQQIRRDYFGNVLAHAATLMFVSRSTQQIHQGVYPQIALSGANRIHGAPIPNSQWPLARIFRSPEDICDRPIRFLILGNLNQHKGAGYLLDALIVCPDLNAEFHFHGGAPDDIRKRYIASLGHRAIFHGRYSPGQVDLSRYDFSLHLSIWPETYCQTLSEAWAAGIVPIVTDIGALGQRVSHGVNGYKVDPDRPATLSKLFMEITSDPQAHLAPRARISDDLFLDQSQHALLYDEAYREVLERRRGSSLRTRRRALVTRHGVTMEVLQQRCRTPFWNKGRSSQIVVKEHLPLPEQLTFLRRIEPFSGAVVHADKSGFDSVRENKTVPIVLKNTQRLPVNGWVENTGLNNPRPVAVLSSGTGIHLHPLELRPRPDVAQAFGNPLAEGWGLTGSISLLTPDVMLTGPVELGIGWHDPSVNLLRISVSTVQIMGKFGA